MTAPLMPVPETAMHENGGAILWKHEIGATRQRTRVKTVPQSGSVQKASKAHFGPRMSLAHARHHSRASSRVDDIRHRVSIDCHAPGNIGHL
jgi:hypothetical protein